MIPLRDNIPSRSTPVVNYTLIALCSLVFVAQLTGGRGGDELVEKYGMIPARVLQPEKPIVVREEVLVQRGPFVLPGVQERPLAEPSFTPWLTLLTCIFLHGGWLHFLGNMWFLHIFGDNVEDRFGHFGYTLFYLGCGVAASAAHLVTNVGSPIPTIGASGAIAGVMGAYFVLYPRAMVLTIIPIFILIEIVVLPAPLFLGIWFFLQFFQGTLAITSTAAGGVAWWAHIGGFVAGMVLAKFLDKRHVLRPRVETVLPNTDRVRAYRYRRSWPS